MNAGHGVSLKNVADPAAWLYARQGVTARTLGALFGWAPALHAQAFGIITYHRVAPRTSANPQPPLNVTPDRFRRQLQGLLDRGYTAWSLDQVLAYRKENEPIPRTTFVVAFDDGFECVYEYAFPILRELGIPATLFLPTAWIDHDGPAAFDPWPLAGDQQHAAAWRLVRTDQCLRMLESGLISLGSHTHSHADFRGKAQAFRTNVHASLTVLRKRFGVERPAFSLPFGFCEPSWPEIVRELGASCCLTTEAQLVKIGDDPYGWGRFGGEQYDSPRSLAVKLNGWFSLMRNMWRPLRHTALTLAVNTRRALEKSNVLPSRVPLGRL
jgi:peptidoglycan/xylan/chitin deacetylase (PgdA/CDA1 family)